MTPFLHVSPTAEPSPCSRQTAHATTSGPSEERGLGSLLSCSIPARFLTTPLRQNPRQWGLEGLIRHPAPGTSEHELCPQSSLLRLSCDSNHTGRLKFSLLFNHFKWNYFWCFAKETWGLQWGFFYFWNLMWENKKMSNELGILSMLPKMNLMSWREYDNLPLVLHFSLTVRVKWGHLNISVATYHHMNKSSYKTSL